MNDHVALVSFFDMAYSRLVSSSPWKYGSVKHKAVIILYTRNMRSLPIQLHQNFSIVKENLNDIISLGFESLKVLVSFVSRKNQVAALW